MAGQPRPPGGVRPGSNARGEWAGGARGRECVARGAGGRSTWLMRPCCLKRCVRQCASFWFTFSIQTPWAHSRRSQTSWSSLPRFMWKPPTGESKPSPNSANPATNSVRFLSDSRAMIGLVRTSEQVLRSVLVIASRRYDVGGGRIRVGHWALRDCSLGPPSVDRRARSCWRT